MPQLATTNDGHTGLVTGSFTGLVTSASIEQNYIVVCSPDGTNAVRIPRCPTVTQVWASTALPSTAATNIVSAGNGVVVVRSGFHSGSIAETATTAWNGTVYVTNGVTPDIIQARYTPPKVDHKRIRVERDRARKALWKSIRLFENLFGLNHIQVFLNGGAFEVEGRKFDYRISKNGTGLIDHTARPNRGHIPYKLEVLSKQGLVLFQGCTVFKNTPIVDQITALILHIRDNEEHVLLNMNLSRLTTDFYSDVESLNYINTLKNTNYKLLGAN